MTLYNAMLFLHLLTVTAVFLAVGVMLSNLVRVPAYRDAGDAAASLRTCATFGKLMPLATLLLLVTGAVMTQSQWGWTTPWVLVGVVGLLVVTAVGGAINGRREHAMLQAVEAAGEGPVSPAVACALFDRTIFIASGFNIGTVCGIMLAMVVKGSLAGSALFVVIGAVAGAIVAHASTTRLASRASDTGQAEEAV